MLVLPQFTYPFSCFLNDFWDYFELLITFWTRNNIVSHVYFQTWYNMHTHSSHHSRSHKLSSLVLILSCLTGMILAQTFQYSRGWTNGRKRAGPASTLIVPPSASGSALYQNLDDSNPCSQLQRIKFLLGARNPQQVHHKDIF